MWLLSIAQMLTVMAAAAQPELLARQGSTVLDPISTRQTYFAIPFEIDQVDHPALGAAEIQLYVSRDRGGTWQHETSVAPTTKHFLFRAPGDGEYWFAVRTRDRAGNFRPPLIDSPGLRVVVDTQAPSLTIDAQRGEAGQIIAKWKIDETNIKPETFKLQYRIAGNQQWETIAVDPATFRTEGTTSSGEALWWAPAGQGRIEIRVEVADTAGNPNVSHAQVTTSATGVMSDGGMTYSPASPTQSSVSQPQWQAAPSQNAWAQQNDYATGQLPTSQEAAGYRPNGAWGRETTTLANDPASQGYSPNADSTYAGGSAPRSYGATEPGSAGGQYGTDPYTTAYQPPSSSTQPLSGEPPVGQYSQYQPQQTYGQYDSSSGHGMPGTPSETRTWDGGNSGYGQRDRPDAGSVAAQPAPAYQRQYDPNGDSQSLGPTSPSGYGPSAGYGSPAPGPAAAMGRIVNTKLFEIEYTNPPQPMTVGRVELWGTRDGGINWQSFGYDSDSRSPMLARVPDEGTYGFKVVFHPMYGPPAQAPSRGEMPGTVIRVDLTRPDARLLGVDRSPSMPNQLSIRWQAADIQLADMPIALYYADAATGQWRLIEQGLQNSGEYRWNLPIGLPPEVQIRVEAHDRAGNVTTAETRNPIRLAEVPRAPAGTPSYSVEIQNVRPLGQTDQAPPRRYYIR